MRWLVFLLLTFGVSLTMSATTIPSPNHQTATFAGGCFWCLEPPYSEIIGIISLYPGYTGGKEIDPTYDQVSSGKTGHLEAIQIQYDSSKVDYTTLLDIFWRQIDFTSYPFRTMPASSFSNISKL